MPDIGSAKPRTGKKQRMKRKQQPQSDDHCQFESAAICDKICGHLCAKTRAD
jgi:hypothetical protein